MSHTIIFQPVEFKFIFVNIKIDLKCDNKYPTLAYILSKDIVMNIISFQEKSMRYVQLNHYAYNCKIM